MYLAEKLRPVVPMLNCIEGVLVSPNHPKQGGEQEKESVKPLPSSPSGNEEGTSKPNEPKGKGKVGNDDEEEEEETKKLRRKSHDEVLDENARITREAEEKERVERKAQAALLIQISLFLE